MAVVQNFKNKIRSKYKYNKIGDLKKIMGYNRKKKLRKGCVSVREHSPIRCAKGLMHVEPIRPLFFNFFLALFISFYPIYLIYYYMDPFFFRKVSFTPQKTHFFNEKTQKNNANCFEKNGRNAQ